MLRPISSRWRIISPRGSTVTTAPLKATTTPFELIRVNEIFYKKIEIVFDHSVWKPLWWGYIGVRRLVTRLGIIICVVNRCGGDDVGTSTHPLPTVPTGPHDFHATHWGRNDPHDGNTQTIGSVPTGSMVSNANNKTPRETDTSNTMSDSQRNKKQKQKQSHRECDSQSSVSSCIYVDFKCVTININ